MSSGPLFRTPVTGPAEKRPVNSVSSETVEAVANGADSYATNKTFEELKVSPELVAVLSAQGITTAFPIQAMTIHDALAGRDVCGKAKTGSGKTLGFGLPLLQRIAGEPTLSVNDGQAVRPRWLVLLPTRALAVQA